MKSNGPASFLIVAVALAAAVLAIAGCHSLEGARPSATRYFLYAANTHSNDISAYSIDADSGGQPATDLGTHHISVSFTEALPRVDRLEVLTEERPPMIEIPEYQKKFHPAVDG
jgi:hypothetical protein